MDCMCEIAFGYNLNSLQLGDLPFANAFDRGQEIVVDRLFSSIPYYVKQFFRIEPEVDIMIIVLYINIY